MANYKIRRRGDVFYVSFKCVARRCSTTWQSSYFQEREDAATYAAGAPHRGPRARCLAHRPQKAVRR
jgi:hypothetical protein